MKQMFFLELSCFFDDLADVGNLVSGSSAFFKTSLNIRKFMVHVLLKPGLENFEPFPSPVDHILSDLSTMTRPSWVAPRAWLSFIELDKAVVLV